ncbi:MAG TPA: hypothetical protein VGG75_21610 [Trebonia sp.]|jgi:hypothetical protein
MDDDVLSEVAASAGSGEADAARELAIAVRDTLSLDVTCGPVFGQHLRNLRLWRRVTLRKARDDGQVPPAPPILALLAALTLAAEEMQHDREFAGNAYYPRLFRVLQVNDGRQQARLQSAYRKDAEELWGGLNEWLSAADGRLGVPTAYALSHRYIGLPLSQALVRAADRRQFPLLFNRYGLTPGGEVSLADMEGLLDGWLGMRPCPVSRSLESLWSRGQARERIASVAAVELRSWDGTLPDGVTHDPGHPGGRAASGGVQLACWVRRFPRRSLDISFLASFRSQAAPRAVTVLTAAGEPEVDVVPVPGARVQPMFTSEIDTASLVEGVLRLADPVSGLEVSRFPRRVAAFRHDDLLNAYVECERVQLGEDCLLLVKNDKGLTGAVRELLTGVARPGFSEHSTFPGLPDGWVLFTGVQVVSVPDREPAGTDLNALIPLLSSQLAFAGGTKLPGQLRKWSSLDPPEVRAVAHGASRLTVRLTPLHDAGRALAKPHAWTREGPALVACLRELSLPDGDYEVTLEDGGKSVHQAVLRLRSSNTPDVAALLAVTRLAHDTGHDRLAALRALPSRSGAPHPGEVRGPCALREPPLRVSGARAGGEVWWNDPKPPPPPRQPPVTLTAVDPASCVVTGAHYIELPVAYGRPKGGLISGTCRQCGLVKRFPARIRWQRDDRGSGAAHGPLLQVGPAELPQVADGLSSWDVAQDSLVHASGGSYHVLEAVAAQVEGSPLFTDTFTRALEARGDLEVERGDGFNPVRWEMTPAWLAGLADGTFLLTGNWSLDDRQALQDLVTGVGGTVRSERDRHELARRTVTGVSAAALTGICEKIGTAGVVPDAGSRMVSALQPLREVEAALPRVPLPAARHVQRFHLESSSWTPSATAAEPGAYRLDRGFTRTYVFRTAADVAAGTAAVTPVQLAKHLAAWQAGRALLAYDLGGHALAVPLGADLPGLYGRAAVLFGGRLPTADEPRRVLAYHDVPQHAADALTFLLTS